MLSCLNLSMNYAAMGDCILKVGACKLRKELCLLMGNVDEEEKSAEFLVYCGFFKANRANSICFHSYCASNIPVSSYLILIVPMVPFQDRSFSPLSVLLSEKVIW